MRAARTQHMKFEAKGFGDLYASDLLNGREPLESASFGSALPRRLMLALAALCLAFGYALAGPAMARTLELNADWRFNRGDQPGVEQPTFDDHGWRTVAVPHD